MWSTEHAHQDFVEGFDMSVVDGIGGERLHIALSSKHTRKNLKRLRA